MGTEPKFRRVLLKISGEALAGDQKTGLNFNVIGQVCDVIKTCTELGVQVGVVIGGGNFWRGVKTVRVKWPARAPTTWACWRP